MATQKSKCPNCSDFIKANIDLEAANETLEKEIGKLRMKNKQLKDNFLDGLIGFTELIPVNKIRWIQIGKGREEWKKRTLAYLKLLKMDKDFYGD